MCELLTIQWYTVFKAILNLKLGACTVFYEIMFSEFKNVTLDTFNKKSIFINTALN